MSSHKGSWAFIFVLASWVPIAYAVTFSSPAFRSDWVFLGQIGGGNFGCFDELTASDHQIPEPACFDHFTSEWPNTEEANGLNAAAAACLPPAQVENPPRGHA